MKTHTRMNNFGNKLLLVLFGALAGLAICEVGLRLLGCKYSGSTWRNDPLLGWSLRPGAGAWEVDEGVAWSKINSQGYRDREHTVNKPQGVFRVAMLGDSYTEARQVAMDKAFTSLAEEELNRRHCLGERRVEVLNFGIGGYGTGQELLLLRERVWKFSPDMVVLQFYAGNDIYNNYRALNISSPDMAPYFQLRDKKLVLDESFRKGRAFNPLYIKLKGASADVMNRLVLLQLIYKLSRMHAQKAEMARLTHEKQATAASNPPSDPNAPPPDYQRFLSLKPPAIPAMIEAWEVTEALIAELGKEVSSHNIPLLITVIPTNIQINPDPNKQEALRVKYEVESLEYADDRVERFAKANGIPVLRLTKPLAEEARRSGTYLAGFPNTGPWDGHLNERGHEVVARELVQIICEIIAPQAAVGEIQKP